MYTPTPQEIALAFDLGEPPGDLVHVRRGDKTEPARWMGDREAIEVAVSNSLRALPDRVEELRSLA